MITNINQLDFDIQKISVKKGDVLVFTLPSRISDIALVEFKNRIGDNLNHFIKDGVKVLVTTDETKISIITQEV